MNVSFLSKKFLYYENLTLLRTEKSLCLRQISKFAHVQLKIVYTTSSRKAILYWMMNLRDNSMSCRVGLGQFFGLSCLVISVGNKVSFKIYSNQANRYTCSDCPQENTDFPHLDPVVPRVKFGSFFQNSYRSNDLTNS